MSSTWNLYRTLAAGVIPDANLEATQTMPAPAIPTVQPKPYLSDRGDNMDEIALMFLATTAGVLTSTTVDFQVIEQAPNPETAQTNPGARVYIGRTPVSAHPTGRIYIFPARYLHAFIVRVTALAAGDTLKIFWRPYR